MNVIENENEKTNTPISRCASHQNTTSTRPGSGRRGDCRHSRLAAFQPRGDRPVYYSDCFSRQRGGSGRSSYR